MNDDKRQRLVEINVKKLPPTTAIINNQFRLKGNAIFKKNNNNNNRNKCVK